ncbi:LLM class flavin-dependent oxidoreductase [Actinocorallia longicatena]|uniref:Luciferase-like domain-containing protein n=1 Tax=Actinocorallia longicatena TaxID=111803 RepID=A0ABP6Q5X0_9ACTN
MPQFGHFLAPGPDAVRVAVEADRLGLDLLGVQDHPYQRRLDCLALMATVLAVTGGITVFPDVACLPLRPPQVLAGTLASLDVLSGGRAELGLGGGIFWDAITAHGGPHRTPRASRTALAEAVQVIRLLWSGEKDVRFEGEHYRLGGGFPAIGGPVPVHPMGIWLGVTGRRSLEIAGTHADGWIPSSSFVPPERLAEGHRIIDDAAHAAGRKPSEIRRIYNFAGPRTAAELADLVIEHRMDTLIHAGDPAWLPVLAHEVAPAVREMVAGRAGARGEPVTRRAAGAG